jgi:hypothetical protein
MIDITKKYTTEDGVEVRLISDKGHPNYPIVGFLGCCAAPTCWDGNGRYATDRRGLCNLDLIEVPEEITGWVNIYNSPSGYRCAETLHDTKQAADKLAGDKRITCIEIKFKKGEGLND